MAAKAQELAQIRPGDLIGYFEGGRVVHFAVVVGYDPDGYPLVISHSADRYRVPWDLGWDRSTRFLLYHVHYPPVAAPNSSSPAEPSGPPAVHNGTDRMPGPCSPVCNEGAPEGR